MNDPTYRMLRLIATTILVLALLLGVFGALNAAIASPSEPPAHTIQSYARYTLLTANGITQTTTGTGVRIAGYDFADCFGAIDVASAQTVTLGFQSGADGTNYAPVVSLTAQSADTTVFTRTAIYGEYFRTVAALAGSNAVTVSVRCVMKN